MNSITLLITALVIVGASIFNYLMNWAPGSEPQDFEIGPSELHIRCDCSLNVLIVSVIVCIAIGLSSYAFTREELYTTGIIAFLLITLSGVAGRQRRYREWKELESIFESAIPTDRDNTDGRINIFFEDDTDNVFFDDDTDDNEF